MKTKEEVEKYYIQQIDDLDNQMIEVRSKINRISFLRLLLVVLVVVSFFVYGGTSIITISSLVVAVVIFLAFLKRHNSLFHERDYIEKKQGILNKELESLKGDYSDFDGGDEFIDASHSFSLDLDLFGDKSIFQVVNRTTNTRSRNKLKDRFLNPLLQKSQIVNTQDAIKELTSKPDFLFDFLTKGTSKHKDFDIVSYMDSFLQNPIFATAYWRYLFILPILIILVAIGFFVSGFPSSIFVIAYCILFLIGMIPMGGITKKMKAFDQMIVSVKSYIRLLKTVEQLNCESEELKGIKEKLVKEQSKATKAIQKLEQLSNQLSLSSTLLGVVLLNPLALWNVYYTRQLQKWFSNHRLDVENWVEGIADIDSLISLVIYSFNHPEYITPMVNSEEECIIGKELIHPLMKKDVAVGNDINVSSSPQFLIVTGANMAGKSTYLRTVSLNLLLAEMGLPVCATQFEFYPFSLITNLRTSDSLANNESYFFSELKKLKTIIDLLESGKKLFIVLDEILKGTNSDDKQKGSIALMKQLLENKGYGIIATHDLVLGDLEKEYPKQVKNYRFEGVIKDNELTFSYKLNEGVAQTMNACFLMKKMGIKGL